VVLEKGPSTGCGGGDDGFDWLDTDVPYLRIVCGTAAVHHRQ